MTAIYFIKCFISMGICWGLYKLLLADKKSFLFNRAYLLASLIGLSLVPFLILPSFVTPVLETVNPQIGDIVGSFELALSGDVMVAQPEIAITESRSEFDYMNVFYGISMILIIRIIYNLLKLEISAIKDYHHKEGRIRVINSSYKNTPFSYFNNLFISIEELDNGLPKEILAHEECHINHYHSIDRIIAELILVIQWWNPFAYLLIRDLKENHEYTADDYVLKTNDSPEAYTEQLLNYNSTNNSNRLFQIGFAQSSMIKRVKMINTKNEKIKSALRYVMIPLVFVLLYACSDTSQDYEIDDEIVDLTIIMGHLNEARYQYPTSIVERAYDPHMLTGWPEYRSPSLELFEKFKTDENFEIVLDEKALDSHELKSLNYNSVVSFKVYDISNLKSGVDFKADLYTKKGYFDMMEKTLDIFTIQLADLQDMAKEYNVDLLESSIAKYNRTGGAPESEIPQRKVISDRFFEKLKDPSKYNVQVNYDYISNSDLVNREPSEFSYYISDKITVGRKKPNVNLITNDEFDRYINRMKNGMPKELRQKEN